MPHDLFDVKMDFTRKARFLARGNLTTTTPNVTHSSVVSRDSVRLAFLIAGLNDLDIVACNISNSCLNAPCGEKIWFQGGKDTGEDKGKVLMVDRALHGLRSSGASWRNNMLSKTLQEDFGFEATRADLDVHRRPPCHDGFEHCECIFVCVDDLLIPLKKPMNWTKKLGNVHNLPDRHTLEHRLERLNCLMGSPRGTWKLTSVSRMQLKLCRSCWMKTVMDCRFSKH